MSFALTQRFVTHRYWAATLVMLASLVVALAGALHLQGRETAAR